MVSEILARIKEATHSLGGGVSSGDSPYIYRGEIKCYDKVSSGLYRYYERKFEPIWKELSENQKGEILKSSDSPNGGILGKRFAEVQHLGGKTNWIDFTRDPRVALFFACFEEFENVKEYEEPGRIIVVKESDFDKGNIVEPCGQCVVNPSQKSVLVRPNSGVIDIANARTIKVPLEPPSLEKAGAWREIFSRKIEILDELDEKMGISFESLYRSYDVQGYIRFQRMYLAYIGCGTTEEGEEEGIVLQPGASPRKPVWMLKVESEDKCNDIERSKFSCRTQQ